MRLSTSLRLNAQKGLVTPYDPALTLDLQFAARQAYVANIGPLPTFTNLTTTARTFVGSDGLIQTAATNVPRIDFDPVTRLCRGLLIEEQRSNLCIHSENVPAANWGKSNISVTADQTTAPTGVVSADLVAETAVSGFHSVTVPSGSVTSGTTYSVSVFLKKGSGSTAPNWVILALGAQFPSSSVAFNVSTGAFGSFSGTSFTYTVKQYPNGWWRVELVATATGTGSSQPLSIIFSNNANTASAPSYLGQTTSDVFVWGAQFEAGAFATSYIPTTTGSLIRSADVCSITGAAFTGFYNQTEGTIVVKAALASVGPVVQGYAFISDGTSNNRICLRHTDLPNERYFVNVGGVNLVNIGLTSVSVNTQMGMAARYKLNDYAASVSGGVVGTDASATVPSVNKMDIGNELGLFQLNGWIQAVQYYNTIKTNAQLQALSTP